MLEGLTCPQCSKNFNKSQRQPRMIFQCGHTYCQECLEFFLSHNQKQFTCPLDQKEILLENQTIENFPVNQTLLQLVSESNSFQTSQMKDPSENQIDQIENQITKEQCYQHKKKKDDLRHFIKQGLAINEEMLIQKQNMLRIKNDITKTYFKFEIHPGIIESKKQIRKDLQKVKQQIDEQFEENKRLILEKVDEIWDKFEAQFRNQLKQENFESRIGLWIERTDEMNIQSDNFNEKFQKLIDLEVNQYGLKHINTAQDIMNYVLEVQDRLTIGFEDFKSNFSFSPNFPQNQQLIKYDMPQITFESNLINENLDQNILQDETYEIDLLDDVQNVSNSRNFLKRSSRNTSRRNHTRYSQDPGFFQKFKNSTNVSDYDNSRKNSINENQEGQLYLDITNQIKYSDDKSDENILLKQESIPIKQSFQMLDTKNNNIKSKNSLTERQNIHHRKQQSYLKPIQNDNYNFPNQFNTQNNHKRGYSQRSIRRQTFDNDTSKNSIQLYQTKKKKSFIRKQGEFSGKKLPSLSPIPRDRVSSLQKKDQQNSKKSLRQYHKIPQMNFKEAIEAIKAGAKNINLSNQSNLKRIV